MSRYSQISREMLEKTLSLIGDKFYSLYLEEMFLSSFRVCGDYVGVYQRLFDTLVVRNKNPSEITQLAMMMEFLERKGIQVKIPP